MVYRVKIEAEARIDIQEAIDWYNKQQQGLGKRFHAALLNNIDNLCKHPYFEIRYDKVHCLPIKKFPFMIHYTIDESIKTIVIRAVFHTSLDSKKWEKR